MIRRRAVTEGVLMQIGADRMIQIVTSHPQNTLKRLTKTSALPAGYQGLAQYRTANSEHHQEARPCKQGVCECMCVLFMCLRKEKKGGKNSIRVQNQITLCLHLVVSELV